MFTPILLSPNAQDPDDPSTYPVLLGAPSAPDVHVQAPVAPDSENGETPAKVQTLLSQKYHGLPVV
jgi:hypothetical protein